MGSGCGLVGRAVASNTRGPWFEFSHRRFFYKKHLFTYCQLCCKDEKTKRPEMAHKKTLTVPLLNGFAFYQRLIHEWHLAFATLLGSIEILPFLLFECSLLVLFSTPKSCFHQIFDLEMWLFLYKMVGIVESTKVAVPNCGHFYYFVFCGRTIF